MRSFALPSVLTWLSVLRYGRRRPVERAPEFLRAQTRVHCRSNAGSLPPYRMEVAAQAKASQRDSVIDKGPSMTLWVHAVVGHGQEKIWPRLSRQKGPLWGHTPDESNETSQWVGYTITLIYGQ